MSEDINLVIDSSEEVSLPQPKKRDLFFTKQVDQDSIAALTENILAIEKHDKYIKKLYALHNLDYSPRPINIYHRQLWWYGIPVLRTSVRHARMQHSDSYHRHRHCYELAAS